MNIQDLANETYSNNATIIRICHKLGCEGFKDFKVNLAKEIESEKFLVLDVDFTKPFEVTDTQSEIIHQMSSLFRTSLDEIQTSVSSEALTRIAYQLLHAGRIFVYASGDSQITAMSFLNKLKKIGIFGSIANEYNEIFTMTQEYDIALFISYSGQSANYQQLIYHLKQNHTRVLCLTAEKDSLLSKMSDDGILIPDLEGGREERISTFYSQFAFSYLLNVIYALMYQMYESKEKGVD